MVWLKAIAYLYAICTAADNDIAIVIVKVKKTDDPIQILRISGVQHIDVLLVLLFSSLLTSYLHQAIIEKKGLSMGATVAHFR